MAIAAPERIKGRKLFVTTRDDRNDAGPRLPGIWAQYEAAPEPREIVILDGSAHGQRIFGTPDADRLMREILRFLSAAVPEGDARGWSAPAIATGDATPRRGAR
jgi:hypothetical protein